MSFNSNSAGPRLRTTLLEVSYRRRRVWSVHATYETGERANALAEAVRLEKRPGIEGTKVTKEIWSPNSPRSQSTVIYRSKALQAEMVEFAEKKQAEAAARSPEPDDYALYRAAALAVPQEKIINEVSLGRALPWVLGAFVGASMLGGLITILMSMGMNVLPQFAINIDRQSESGILVAGFVFFTGYPFIIALRRILRNVSSQRRIVVAPRPAGAPEGRHGQGLRPYSRAAHDAEQMLEAEFIADVEIASDEEVMAAALQHGIDLPAAEAGPDYGTDKSGTVPRGVVLSVEQAGIESEIFSTPEPEKESVAQKVQRFEEQLRGALNNCRDQLDNSQRIAVNLFIAGAIARFAQKDGADGAASRSLLAGTLIRVGTPPKLAASFAASLDEHLVHPRSLAMFDTGREAAARVMENADWDGLLDQALTAWDAPQPAPPAAPVAAPEVADEAESDASAPADETVVLAVAYCGPQTTADDDAGRAAFLTVVGDVVRRFEGSEIDVSGDRLRALFRDRAAALASVYAICAPPETAVAAGAEDTPDASEPASSEPCWRLAVVADAAIPAGATGSSGLVARAHQLLERAGPGDILTGAELGEGCEDARFVFTALAPPEAEETPGAAAEIYVMSLADGAADGAGNPPAGTPEGAEKPRAADEFQPFSTLADIDGFGHR